VRRPLSLISAAVLAATSLVALSQSPVSASSAPEIKRSTTVSPAAIANATSLRSARLTRSNQMLVLGQNTTTPGSNLHMWRVNDDLSFDSKFGTIDLGADFASPTASNSTCVSNPSPNSNTGCSYVNSFAINETADRFAFTYTRQLKGSGSSSAVSTPISMYVIGKISTGEIIGKLLAIEYLVGQYPASDWSYLGVTDLAASTCQTGAGSTYGGVALKFSNLNSWSTMIRPDGSILMSNNCDYSNRVDGQPVPSSLTEYDVQMYFALKPSGGSLVIDTSFGTNGFKSVFDATSTCGYVMPSFSVNTSLTSNTSTALFAPLMVTTFPRQNTVPNSPSFNGVSTYSGCYESGPSQSFSSRIVSIQADGTTKNTVNLPTGFDYFINRWVIDPQGRWNASVRPMPMGGQQSPNQPSVEFIRLLPDGSSDTSFGTNGIKAMTSLPRPVTVNGTSVSMNYSISGFATTATDILFTGFAIASPATNCGSPPYPDSSATYYPYYVSSETGLVTSYGNNGLGDPVTIELIGAERCSPTGAARTSYINSSGAHVLFAQLRAVGAQAAGLTSVTWPRADGVTGGGEGVGAVGVQGRTDNKVYSRKLPARTQEGTALKVLTKKTSRTQMLRSTTPKICVTLTESVVLVDEGRCNVQIVNKEDRRVVRSLSTRVRSTDVEVGTTVEVEDAIPFARVSTRLSKAAQEQVAELAESAATAKRIILVGHTALLTEATVSNNFISLQRAAAVKAALQAEFKKAGVNVPISITALGSRAPLTTKSSEAAQSRNRRVDVYVMP